MDDPAPQGDGHRFRAIPHLELREDVLHVRLHRLLGDPHRRANLLVRLAERQVMDDLPLAGRQDFGALAGGKLDLHFGRHPRFPAHQGVDRRDHLVAGAVLEQIAGRSGIEGRKDVLVPLETGEHQDPRLRSFCADQADRLHPAEHRHPQVHDRDIRLQPLVHLRAFRTIGGLGDHNHAGLAADQAAQAFADDEVVVDDENLNGLRGHLGEWVRKIAAAPRRGPRCHRRDWAVLQGYHRSGRHVRSCP